jgi:hypothetical protein
MANGLALCLTGEHADSAAAAIKDRLAAHGRRAEVIDASLAERIGSSESRTLLCEVLIRNEVVVLITTDSVLPPRETNAVYGIDVDQSWSLAVERAFTTSMQHTHRVKNTTTPAASLENSQPPDRVGNAK